VSGTHRMQTILLYAVATVVVVVIGTYIAGQLARNKLAQQYPPPGKLINSGSRQLHVDCRGDGPITVLLEAGLNDFSIHWNRVVSLLEKETKTCAYDRVGLGWSGPNTTTANIQDAATDLHQVVSATSEHHPIILVGHSYGSMIVRLYAQLHPENIRAIILLDPASEYMPERIDGYAEVLAQGAAQFKTLSRLANIGLVALLTSKIPAGDLSGIALEQYRAVLASGHFLSGAVAESQAMVSNLKYMQNQDQSNLANIPIVIISRGMAEPIPGLPQESSDSLEETWKALQSELVTRLHAKQIIAKTSSHSVHLHQPELVYQTIKSFLAPN